MGAGGGIRTHRGLRPEQCQSSAFANFATPAPQTATNQAILSAQHAYLTATAVPQSQCSENNLIAIIVLLRGLAFSNGMYEVSASFVRPPADSDHLRPPICPSERRATSYEL